MNRSWARFILPTLLLALGVAWCAQARTPATSAPAPSASSAAGSHEGASALLGGLRPGDTIDEWTVDRFEFGKSVKDQPQLAVELSRKGSGITVWVARKEAVDNPPISTERYGISYGHPRPYGDPIPEDSFARMGEKIAEKVRANEQSAPTPAGL